MSIPPPCPEWADALAARVPEDLSPSQREALARHLASCQRCAQASTDYDALTERVRAATREDRFLGLTHQLARLRTEMRPLSKPDLLVSSPLRDSSPSQPFSSSIPGARMSNRAEQANKGHGLEGMLRITDEIQVHYQMMGSGLHPLLIPAVRWPLTACEELLHEHTLVFYNRHQRRRSKESLHSVPSPERELEALFQHLDLAEVSLVGWSSFGGIATRYALEHAERIARLLLIRPVPEPLVEDEPPAQGQGTEDRARFRSWGETGRDRDPIISKGISLAGASSCHIPTLIIHGGDDPLPVSSSQAWAATLPNARLLTMPGAGSSPWDDAPHLFFAAVTQFLTGVWPQGAVSIEARSA